MLSEYFRILKAIQLPKLNSTFDLRVLKIEDIQRKNKNKNKHYDSTLNYLGTNTQLCFHLLTL